MRQLVVNWMRLNGVFCLPGPQRVIKFGSHCQDITGALVYFSVIQGKKKWYETPDCKLLSQWRVKFEDPLPHIIGKKRSSTVLL